MISKYNEIMMFLLDFLSVTLWACSIEQFEWWRMGSNLCMYICLLIVSLFSVAYFTLKIVYDEIADYLSKHFS